MSDGFYESLSVWSQVGGSIAFLIVLVTSISASRGASGHSCPSPGPAPRYAPAANASSSARVPRPGTTSRRVTANAPAVIAPP